MHNICSIYPAIIGQSIDANVVNDEEEKGTSTSMLHQLPIIHTHKLARYGYDGKASGELWNKPGLHLDVIKN